MPSLHVAAHALFAFWSRRHFRPLYYPWILATIWTFFGSVATGWHYAIDGYVGILLAWVCYRIARIGVSKDEDGSTDSTEETTPAEPEDTVEGDLQDAEVQPY